ncbi:MAG: hypothetical protein MJE77_35535 [Proteobacteria bacterium]|nr:hypothetical protein [Pseudomonadota bacterium]
MSSSLRGSKTRAAWFSFLRRAWPDVTVTRTYALGLLRKYRLVGPEVDVSYRDQDTASNPVIGIDQRLLIVDF